MAQVKLIKWQKEVALDSHRFKIICAGRRAGKSVLSRLTILKWATENVGRYWIVSPTYKMSKMIHWRELIKEVPREWVAKKNEVELSITLTNGSLIELKGAENPDCYDEATQICTKDRGWIYFKELTKDDEVLTQNSKSMTPEWQRPTDIIAEDYDGEMYHYNNVSTDLLVTPNHKFFVEKRHKSGWQKHGFVPIKDIDIGRMRVPSGKAISEGKDFGDDWMRLIGIYLAEGTAYGNCGGDIKKRRGNYSVFIASVKKEQNKWVSELLDRLGYKYRYRGDGFVVLNKDLWEKLLPLGNKYTKYIPQEYLSAKESNLRSLYEGMVMGDGWTSKGQDYYASVSERLVDGFQTICALLGYTSNKKLKKQYSSMLKDGRKIVPTRDIWVVSVRKSHNKYFSSSKRSYLNKVDYKGKIYCCTVPNHIVRVRRSGKDMWSGNSLRGVKLRGLIIDEIASIRNWDWLWSEVLRPTLTDYEAPAMFISTPKGFDSFYELYQMGLGKDSNYKSWRFNSYDNPHISRDELESAKKELTEDTFAQEYLADFRKYTGLVYKNFDRSTHVIEPFTIPDDWYIFRGLDFGSTNPTACLWVAVDSDDNLFVISEHYATGETIDYHAGIINSNPYSSRVTASYGDPSGAQWINEFASRGIYITPANKETGTSSDNWVRYGIEKISERLKVIPGHFVNVLGNTQKSQPKLFVFNTCENLIREFETYRWKEKSVNQARDINEPDAPEKANDHALDSLRYIVVSYAKPKPIPAGLNDFSKWAV